MDLADTFQTLAISLGLGLLVGLQRERVDAPLAGIRTFSLITILGTLSGLLAQTYTGWVIVGGLIAVSLTIIIGNFIERRNESKPSGITTEIAILVMYLLGAYLVTGHTEVAVVVGGGVALLLHAKGIMHTFVDRLGDVDMRAIMQFVLITLVILPVLPDVGYGPFGVLNPHNIWRMVALVVGISLAGYVALKFFGESTGAVLGGLLGGMVSSTATTVSFARRATGAGGTDGHIAAATLVISLAGTVVYGRVLAEIAAAAPQQFSVISPPIFVMLGVAVVVSFVIWFTHRKIKAEMPEQSNPAELKAALIFGGMYALVLLAVAAGEHYFSHSGLYVVAGISGLTDMDAITLSTSGLAAGGSIEPSTAWRAILIATIANLVFKTGIVAMLGGRALLMRIAIVFGIHAAAAVVLLIFWPATRGVA